MGLWDYLTGQFVDVIEHLEDAEGVMVTRFERENDEIKYGAMLTVRESQVAVFINEGQIADVFPPGLYQLETANLPILSSLQAWPHGFKSPFKAEVYFLSTKQFTDLKWGTKNPLMMRDPEFGPLRLRSFGSYTIRVDDAALFLQEVAGTDGYFTTSEITDQLRNIIVSRFADIVANAHIPVLDLAANYNDLGDFLKNQINPEFAEYGLKLTKLLVENISLPEEVEAALDKRTSMGVINNLDRFTHYQTADAVVKAAENPGGDGASGIAMGMGIAIAEKLGKSLASPPKKNTISPPPLPVETVSYYLAIDGKRAGPYDEHELVDQATAGTLQKETLVWREGMRKWRAAKELQEIDPIWAALPPPIPTDSH